MVTGDRVRITAGPDKHSAPIGVHPTFLSKLSITRASGLGHRNVNAADIRRSVATMVAGGAVRRGRTRAVLVPGPPHLPGGH